LELVTLFGCLPWPKEYGAGMLVDVLESLLILLVSSGRGRELEWCWSWVTITFAKLVMQ
jgi:hypothetical protein